MPLRTSGRRGVSHPSIEQQLRAFAERAKLDDDNASELITIFERVNPTLAVDDSIHELGAPAALRPHRPSGPAERGAVDLGR